MTITNPGARAVDAYQIEDIFLVESYCKIDRQLNPTELIQEVGVLFRMAVAPEVNNQVRTSVDPAAEKIYIIRYFVTGEARVLKPNGGRSAEEAAEKDAMGTLRLTFAADYRCQEKDVEDNEAIAAFVKNVVLHVWPFWREATHEIAARMRLPKFIVPMNKPTPVHVGMEIPDAAAAEQ